MAADLIQRMEFFSRLVREGDFCAGTQAVAFMLLYRFYNGGTGRCDPGQSAIARACGITQRHVKRATEELKAAGWFNVRPGSGTATRYGPTTAYQPRFERVTSSSGGDESVRGQQGVTNPSPDDEFVRQGVTSSSARTSNRTSKTLLVDFSEETASQFENFWRVYPSRGDSPNPKKPARLRFASALKKGVDPSEIIAGAKRYAESVRLAKTEPQYIAQAKTWLGEERWADQPKPVANSGFVRLATAV